MTTDEATAHTTRRSMVAVGWAVLLTVLTNMPVFLIGALANQISTDIRTGAASIGFAVGMYWVGAALASMSTARMTRRLSEATLGALAIVCATVSLLGSALWLPSWHWLIGWALIGGLGNGCGHPASNHRIVGAVRNARLGLSFGIKQAAVPLAGLVAGLLVPLTALRFGWHAAFAEMAAVGAVLLLVSVRPILRERRSRRQRTTDPRVRRGLIPAVRNELLIVATMTMLSAGACNSVLAFAVTGALDRGIDYAGAGAVLAGVSSMGAVSRFSLGVVADRFDINPFRIITAVLLCCTTGFGLMLIPGTATYVIGIVLAGGIGGAWAGLVHLSIARLAGESTASATGLVQTGSYIGSAAGPVAAGALIAVGSVETAWIALGTMALIATALSFVVNRRLRRFRARAAPLVDRPVRR
ncbi:MFS transporter [Rhodococcus sp. B10]|uniref:MFS transporter n=1 Tax=Rhodococcus sp. B10 TaxID=2695876 RepID=UPI001432038E|nr:MFS transporter [Rhodococcus sp. B10]NIL77276.1 hypothetical protein [Rhodococcus sp. B10]